MAIEPGKNKPVEMTASIFATQHPAIHAEACNKAVVEATKDMEAKIEAGNKEGYSKGLAEGTIKASKAERERILSVESKAMPGYEAIIKARKEDGKSTGPDTAEAILEAMKERQAKGLKALKDEAPVPITPELDEKSTEQADAAADPIKATWETGKLSAKLKKEFGGDYDSYKAYYENDEHYKETKQVIL